MHLFLSRRPAAHAHPAHRLPRRILGTTPPTRLQPVVLRLQPKAASPLQPEQETTKDDVDDGLACTPLAAKAAQRRVQRQREQTSYQWSAIAASTGITTIALAAVYLRFQWHMVDDGSLPWLDMAATCLLVGGGVVFMEFWARWAHKVLWHDYAPGWALHKSHHEPRLGPFEANDVFAIVNAVPAIALCAYGLFREDVIGGVCFGAGLGITVFGIMYMFVHDGLVHKRFPVGPVAKVPYLKRVAVAHKLHHSEKYNGVPWGLFLGPQELEAVGAKEELDKMVAELDI